MHRLPISDIRTVLILKADHLCANILQQVARRVFPAASFRLVDRVKAAAALLAETPVDLLVTGINLPDGDALDHLAVGLAKPRRIRRVLVVTGRSEPWVLQTLRALGVEGMFDPLSEMLGQFRHALLLVAAGHSYWSPSALERLRQQRISPTSLSKLLTPAEQLVLAVIGDGCDDHAAAELLGIKPSSVQSVRRELHRKLGIQHKGGLMQVAAQHGSVRFTPDGVQRPGFSILRAACHTSHTKPGDAAAGGAAITK